MLLAPVQICMLLAVQCGCCPQLLPARTLASSLSSLMRFSGLKAGCRMLKATQPRAGMNTRASTLSLQAAQDNTKAAA